MNTECFLLNSRPDDSTAKRDPDYFSTCNDEKDLYPYADKFNTVCVSF